MPQKPLAATGWIGVILIGRLIAAEEARRARGDHPAGGVFLFFVVYASTEAENTPRSFV